MATLNALVDWWRVLPFPWRAWRIVGRVAAGDEVPTRLPFRGVVLVGATGGETWAAFDCACRTRHRLMVNLNAARSPFWTIESRKPLSIYPSIDSVASMGRCHFTILNGKTRWAAITDEE